MARRAPRLSVALLAALALSASLAGAAWGQPNSSDRMIIWTGCEQLASLTDAELDLWKGRGVDGFACMAKHLWGMGGVHDFTGDPAASLAKDRYALQRQLRDSGIGARASARGMKVYLGAYLVNYWNKVTPMRDWFDDAGWTGTALPAFGDLAGAARQLGFAGVAFDHELYPQRDGATTATWNWSYPGNQRNELAVRAKARQRGADVMKRILSGYPRIEVLAYDVDIPQSWGELMQQEVNGNVNAYARRLDVDFLDGMSSVAGYEAIRLLDATFYKSPHRGTWDRAFHYHYNSLYSYLSRRLSSWAHAWGRLHVSPFAWINAGRSSSTWDDAKPASYVAQQLQAFRKWGMGGEFGVYAFGGLKYSDYDDYASVMSEASTPAVVDTEAPTLSLTAPESVSTSSASTELRGKTGDNLALRVVRWVSSRGYEGVAELTWQITSGTPSMGYTGETHWRVPSIPLQPGENRITITAEDIKGLTKSLTVTSWRTGGSPPAPQEPSPTPAPPPVFSPQLTAPVPAPEAPAGARGTPPNSLAHPPPVVNHRSSTRASKRRRRAAKRRAAARRRAEARRGARVRARRRCLRRARSARSAEARWVKKRRCRRAAGHPLRRSRAR
jgi:hypothetical protein